MFLKRIHFEFPQDYAYLHYVFETVFWGALFFISIASIIPGNTSIAPGYGIFTAISNWIFSTPDHYDKIVHFLAYAGLAGLGLLAGLKPLGYKRILFVILIGWSAFIECAQGFAHSRSADILDFLANISGVMAGGLGAVLVFMIVTRFAPSSKARM